MPRGHAVEEEDAVEVVELVLKDARLERRRLEGERLASGRHGGDVDACRTAHVCGQLRDREAALAPELVAFGMHDRWVDEDDRPLARVRLRMPGDVDRDHAEELAELWRR